MTGGPKNPGQWCKKGGGARYEGAGASRSFGWHRAGGRWGRESEEEVMTRPRQWRLAVTEAHHCGAAARDIGRLAAAAAPLADDPGVLQHLGNRGPVQQQQQQRQYCVYGSFSQQGSHVWQRSQGLPVPSNSRSQPIFWCQPAPRVPDQHTLHEVLSTRGKPRRILDLLGADLVERVLLQVLKRMKRQMQ
jgi:hypothetical protein